MKKQIYNPFTNNFEFINDISNENWVKEDFIYPQGDSITFALSALNGGTSAAVTNPPISSEFNMNNSVDIYPRHGVHQIGITTATNSFGAFINSSVVASPRYRLLPENKFYIDGIWRMTLSPIIDFANNPVLACFGLVAFIANTTINPLVGTYFRLNRISESSTIKYVVREGGVETVFDTTISTLIKNTGYIKTGMLWDGPNDTMTYYVTDGTNVWSTTKTLFLTTYFTFVNTNLHFCGLIVRNGIATLGTSVTMQIDSVSHWKPLIYTPFFSI